MIFGSETSRGVLYAAKVRVGTAAGVQVPLPDAASFALDAVQAARVGKAIARTSGTVRRVNQRGIRAPSRSTARCCAARDTGLGLRWSGQPTASRALVHPRGSGCALRWSGHATWD